MNLEGQMVKVGVIHARVVLEFDDYARVVWVDARGRIRYRWYYRDQLTPLRFAYSPKSTWPPAGDLEQRIAEQEEREAKAADQAREKAARKARRRGFRKAAA